MLHTDPTIVIRLLQVEDAPALLDLRLRNRAHFSPYEPVPIADDALTLEGLQKLIASYVEQVTTDRGYRFGIFLAQELIGIVSLAPVQRGPAQSANLGYSLNRDHNGKGYATQAARLALDYAFGLANLHRVTAGVMPRNIGSQRVLEKAGFRCEGLQKSCLLINGIWEDHLAYAITQEEWASHKTTEPPSTK